MQKKYNEGYALGKIALDLASKKSPEAKPEITFVVTGLVCIWKEPLQVAIPVILESYKQSIKSGCISVASMNAVSYCFRQFSSGSTLLSTLQKEVSFFIKSAVRCIAFLA